VAFADLDSADNAEQMLKLLYVPKIMEDLFFQGFDKGLRAIGKVGAALCRISYRGVPFCRELPDPSNGSPKSSLEPTATEHEQLAKQV
jgi:hypothetical protein